MLSWQPLVLDDRALAQRRTQLECDVITCSKCLDWLDGCEMAREVSNLRNRWRSSLIQNWREIALSTQFLSTGM